MSAHLVLYKIVENVQFISEKQGHYIFNDDKTYDIIEPSYIKWMLNNGKHKKSDKLDVCLEGHTKTTFVEDGLNKEYVAVDIIFEGQTSEFRPAFFKRDCTCACCDTYDKMLAFFKRYGKQKGYPLFKQFCEAWEPGMLFICSW